MGLYQMGRWSRNIPQGEIHKLSTEQRIRLKANEHIKAAHLALSAELSTPSFVRSVRVTGSRRAEALAPLAQSPSSSPPAQASAALNGAGPRQLLTGAGAYIYVQLPQG